MQTFTTYYKSKSNVTQFQFLRLYHYSLMSRPRWFTTRRLGCVEIILFVRGRTKYRFRQMFLLPHFINLYRVRDVNTLQWYYYQHDSQHTILIINLWLTIFIYHFDLALRSTTLHISWTSYSFANTITIDDDIVCTVLFTVFLVSLKLFRSHYDGTSSIHQPGKYSWVDTGFFTPNVNFVVLHYNLQYFSRLFRLSVQYKTVWNKTLWLTYRALHFLRPTGK